MLASNGAFPRGRCAALHCLVRQNASGLGIEWFSEQHSWPRLGRMHPTGSHPKHKSHNSEEPQSFAGRGPGIRNHLDMISDPDHESYDMLRRIVQRDRADCTESAYRISLPYLDIKEYLVMWAANNQQR